MILRLSDKYVNFLKQLEEEKTYSRADLLKKLKFQNIETLIEYLNYLQEQGYISSSTTHFNKNNTIENNLHIKYKITQLGLEYLYNIKYEKKINARHFIFYPILVSLVTTLILNI